MKRNPRSAQERNPYSDAASKVLRAVLSNPAKAWGVRELARLADVSPTLSVLVLNRLERLGHVSRESSAQARILDPLRLVKDWASWYAVKPLQEFRYSLEAASSAEKMINLLRSCRSRLPGHWALTSMAGGSLAAPHSEFREIHIHLPRAERLRRSWQDILGLVPEKLGPIHLMQPYYARSAAGGIREIRKLPVVSDLQLYLDCRRYPVGGREQAKHILRSVLLNQWKNAKES